MAAAQLPLPRGVRYYGGGDISGYGLAAVAYVRALVNAGVAVEWIPLDWGTDRMRAGRWSLADGGRRSLLEQCGTRGNLADVGDLVERTRAPIAHDTVVAHAPPEFWPEAFAPGKRNIGMTVWETDRIPAHWLSLMRQSDRVIVPCELNRAAFVRSGLDRPIAVVPHIRRHCWCEFSPAERQIARERLGIPAGHRVLYSINAWDPRKDLPRLVRAVAAASRDDEPVTLLIKTGATGHEQGPLYAVRPSRDLTAAAIADAAAAGFTPPHVVLHDAELDGDTIDLIHAVGDIYVSLSHGEGWGLGAFEAALLAKPVLMTGWGGHAEFLGADWPGAVPWRFAPVPLWPPYKPSYFPSQRWAEPDFDAAVAMLRATLDDPQPALAAARAIRERIVRDYAEPVVIGTLLEALA
jgi:glycosyltransferase involved in cell wall biosynthesis